MRHIMIRVLCSIFIVLLASCSMTSCDGVVTEKYIAVTSMGRSPVCAADQPSTTIAARSKIQCTNECTKRSWCVVHQMNDDKKQCQLFSFLPTNYSSGSVEQCTAYHCNSPSAHGTGGAETCSFPFTYNGALYYTCAVETNATPCQAWCPDSITRARSLCNEDGYDLVDSNFPTGQSYATYIAGFGDIMSNFWLGLNNIYTMTNDAVNGGHKYRLRIEFMNTLAMWFSLEYDVFYIGNPASNYVLYVSRQAKGDVYDALNDGLSPANGKSFATAGVCTNHGFFWYRNPSYYCNFARWFGNSPSGFFWDTHTLRIFRMMIKQIS